MRASRNGPLLKVRAIAGSHVVTLGWDLGAGKTLPRTDLLGFAIERSEFGQSGAIKEQYFLRGIKRFEHKDEGIAPGTPVPTSEHPVQSFQWGDYTARPGVKYRYRVIPAFGTPKLLELVDGLAVSVTITTETEKPSGVAGARPTHEIYFNRGAAGSQAYARRFGNVKPDKAKPNSDQMAWLSRGLFEALCDFIGRADGPRYKLRAMLYEFQYGPVGEAFKAAQMAGADVDIRYEAQSYKDENEEMIAEVGISTICTPQAVRSGIRHNKFIVLIKDGVPVSVWTGSTNISAGGIFGHSNVGHIIHDTSIATRFLDYWTLLARADVTGAQLKAQNRLVEATPLPGTRPPADRILTLFCPRDPSTDNVPTLQWFAEQVASARRISCMTFAFNFDKIFSDVLAEDTDSLNYLVFDKQPDKAQQELVEKHGNTVTAAGAKLDANALGGFIKEELTGFNKNLYIHDKFIVIDPLGSDPVVITGTANFSRPSQANNDENMLVIRGDKRVADIYFGEFMRVFDHLYARYLVKRFQAAQGHSSQPSQPGNRGYLKEFQKAWLDGHFVANSRKALRREYFASS
jgi:hypothetical protein